MDVGTFHEPWQFRISNVECPVHGPNARRKTWSLAMNPYFGSLPPQVSAGGGNTRERGHLLDYSLTSAPRRDGSNTTEAARRFRAPMRVEKTSRLSMSARHGSIYAQQENDSHRARLQTARACRTLTPVTRRSSIARLTTRAP